VEASATTATAATPAPADWRANVATVSALVRRARNEILRVPGAAIPGVLAPTIFFAGLVAVFGNLTNLQGFPTDSYASWLIAISLLQGAGFTGAAAGVNLARDIEVGLFDRFLASPVPRPVLLAGLVLSAGFRALIPATILLAVAFSIGAHFPGVDGLLLALLITMCWGVIAALWGTALALKYKSQSAAPLMQVGMFLAILCTSAYAPIPLLTGWLHTIAQINPVTQVVEAVRQGFLGSVTWAETWPGLLAILGIGALMAAFSLRQMSRTAD
jgi:ABC-type multidrug transport system permease subunit